MTDVFRGKEKGAIEIVDVKEISFVSYECIILQLFA
jgi:hypothetical protein